MKISKGSLMIVTLLVVGLMVTSPVTVGDDSVVQETWCEYDLIAGQDDDAGTVEIYYMSQGDDTWIEVYIITEDGWKISESQVDIQYDSDDFPQTKKGNFKIGKFAYSTPTTATSTEHYFMIDDGWEVDVDKCEDLAIAVHAVVYKGCGEEAQWETAWANGEPFGGNWQMYVLFPCCKYPDYPTDFEVTLNFKHPGSDGYWQITVIDPNGDLDDFTDIWPGVFYGWCIDKAHTMSPGNYDVYLTDPYAYDADGDWDLINWILNHRDGYTVNEVQNAIWHITDGITVTGNAKELADDAIEFGEGFRPSIGQFWGIVTPTPQKNIIVLDP
jgi:hypothetical protein